MPNDPILGPHFIVRGEKRDIFGKTVSAKSRGKDGQEQPFGPFDLTTAEAAVWHQYGFSVKALCAVILRYRKRERRFMATASSDAIDSWSVSGEMPK